METQIYEQHLDTLPKAQAWLERDGTSWAVYCWCPICEDIHKHGGDPAMSIDDDHWGERVAHCLTGPGGSYLLVPAPAGEPRPQGLTRHQRHRRLIEDDRRRGNLTSIGRG